MNRKLKAEIALGITALFTAQAMIPALQPMPSLCVVEKANDFGPPPGCDDSTFAPRAAAAITIASSTTWTGQTAVPLPMSLPLTAILYDALTDVEYLMHFPRPASITLVQPST